MNTGESDPELRRLGQRIPHLEHLVEHFNDREFQDTWNAGRRARLERCRQILERNLNTMRKQAHQLAGNSVFSTLWLLLQRAADVLRRVQDYVRWREIYERGGMFAAMMAVPRGEGQLLN